MYKQEDSLGSLLGSRTCPVGVALNNLTLVNVVVPSVSGVNQVSNREPVHLGQLQACINPCP